MSHFTACVIFKPAVGLYVFQWWRAVHASGGLWGVWAPLLWISCKWGWSSQVHWHDVVFVRKLYKLLAQNHFTENSILFISSSKPLSNKWKACLTVLCVSAPWLSLSVWVHKSFHSRACDTSAYRKVKNDVRFSHCWRFIDRDCNF